MDITEGSQPTPVSDIPGAVPLTAEGFLRVARQLHAKDGLEETAGAALRLAVQATGCTHAGVILVQRRSRLETAAATDPVVARADQLQVEFGEGPALAVMAGEASLTVSDTGIDQRWPTWSPKAAVLGLRSVLAISLRAADTTLGVLELFCARPDAFGATEERAALLLAGHTSIAIAGAQQEATLWNAMDGRRLIGQAQGLLMERFSVDADQAFAILRRYSQDNNRKLRDVAADLLATRQLPD